MHIMYSKYQKLKLTELKRDTVPNYKAKQKFPIIIVLDNIRSMSNIGSIFRTSDAFLIEEMHLCGITSTPPNKEIHKTALGATDSVEWKYYENTIDSIKNLKSAGIHIACVEQAKNSIKLDNLEMNNIDKLALVFGNEVNGVDQSIIDISDSCIEIPQFGTKHSLNVSVSAGIVIWDIFNKISH